MTDSRQKNNYNYVRGQFTTFWQIPDKKIITIMWRQFTTYRFQTKTIITIMWEGNLLPFDRFQTKKIITIMWEGNLLPFDRFQTKKIITIMWEGNLLQIADKKTFDRFPFDNSRKKITIMREGKLITITTYWQIPDKYNNYNYVRGQFTTYWQIPDKKNNYNYVRGQFTTFWQIPEKKLLQLCERAIYYILTDSRQKIITIMWEGNLLHFDSRQI